MDTSFLFKNRKSKLVICFLEIPKPLQKYMVSIVKKHVTADKVKAIKEEYKKHEDIMIEDFHNLREEFTTLQKVNLFHFLESRETFILGKPWKNVLAFYF